MKLQFLGVVVLAGAQLAIMNSTWQSARLLETGSALSVTGFDVAAPLTLVLILQLLALFGAQYWRQLVARIALTITALLSGLILWSTSGVIFGGQHWLESAVTAKTGIADWDSQLSNLTGLSTNQGAAGGAFVVSALMAAWGLRCFFLQRKPAQTKDSVADWVN